MKKRCSIQQGEKDNCWSEQSPEKSTVSIVPFFVGHPVYTCSPLEDIGLLIPMITPSRLLFDPALATKALLWKQALRHFLHSSVMI